MMQVFRKGSGNLWIRFAAVTGTEGLGILVTTVTGFVIIHFLPKEVYGNYVYIISAINFLMALSELGMNHCFLPAVGTRINSESHIGAVTRVILSQRFRFWFCSCFVVIPYWAWTSFQQGWMHPMGILAFMILLMGSWLGLSEQMLRMNAAVRNRPEIVARSNFFSAVTRTLFLFGSFLLLTPYQALPALALASGIGTVASMVNYRRSGLRLPFGKEKSTNEERKIREHVRSILTPLILPSLIFVLYNNFGGMILGWIASGKVIAEAGAVSRLALVLLIIDRLSAVFVTPRLARAATELEYRSLALRFQGAYLIVVCLIEFSIWLCPAAWLLLLGDKYSNLQPILWLGTLGPILMNVSNFTFTMMSCRGQTKKQLPITVLSFGLQIFLYLSWGAPNVWRVFIINIGTAAVFVLGQYFLFLSRLPKKNFREVLNI